MSNNDDLPTYTPRQLTKVDELYQEGLAKDLMEQANRLDELAKQLIKIQLAIPALYAAVLKLSNTPAEPISLLIAFILWLLAFGLSMVSLQPIKYQVNREIPVELPIPKEPQNPVAINVYYHLAAKHKRQFLIPSSWLTFFGITFSVLSAVLPSL